MTWFLEGARIRRIDLPKPQIIGLTLSGSLEGTLLLSAQPRQVSVGLVRSRPPSPVATGFTTFLRKHIEGFAIVGVRVVPGALAFDLKGGPLSATLYLERTPNLVLEKEGRTIGALSVKANEHRGAKLGQPYGAPGGATPLMLSTLEALLIEGEHLFAERQEHDETSARRALLKDVQRQMDRMGRRIVAIERDLTHAERAGELTAEAQLLLACAHQLGEASGVVQLEDPASGAIRSIDLEGRTPFDAAERRFEEARRRRSGEKVARARSGEAMEAKSELERLALRIEDDDVPLDVLALEVRAAVRPAQAPIKGPKGEIRTRLPYREIIAIGARVVLVGKTSADNDELTTKVARAHDLWLHARGMPGSHVVVPLEKGETIEPQLLIDAATLAAHFSDARGEEKVEVSYVERRHVRKKRGSPPGSVQVERDKTLLVRIEPDRLARLLSGKR